MAGTVTRPPDAKRSAMHEQALQSFLDKVQQDRTVLAAILFGSMAYDDVWEKSDVDVMLVTDEEKAANKGYYFVEHGVNIHAVVQRRSQFKKAMEADLGGGFGQSTLMRSTLLFCRDDSIREYYDNVHRLGSLDRSYRLLRAGTFVLPILAKAEKWLYVKGDVDYSFLWLMFTVNGLATIEVLLHGEVPGREVTAQALRHNPAFFRAIYADFIHQPKGRDNVDAALRLINAYLDEHVHAIFQPILDFLLEAGGSRSNTEINEHFKVHAQADDLSFAYEWLADKGIIRKVSAPLRLTMKSRVYLDEAAYYYDGGDKG